MFHYVPIQEKMMAKIVKYFLGLSVTLCLFTIALANDTENEDSSPIINSQEATIGTFSFDENATPNEVEALIEKVEHLAGQAEKTVKEGILPIENTNKIHSNIEETVEELIELLNETTNIYKFLNTRGIERIILPNIGISYPSLKRQLLLLMKNLFDVAPITTTAMIPVGIVDKILDIFEHDNLALKAYALDILQIWLPENPIIQTRVMKMKGLDPFYRQIPNLDADVIGQLLNLFNKILVEHVQARRKDVQRTKADHDRLVMYQRIGLIERISTPVACYGLLHILETTWSFNTEGKEVSHPIIEVIKNVQPYCISFFKANPKRTRLFHELLKYIEDPRKQGDFEALGLNITDTQVILNEYNNIFKDVFVKDEF